MEGEYKMKYLAILLILFSGTLLIDEPLQYAAMGRGTGRIYSRGTGTVTTPVPLIGAITVNGVDLTINGETINAH
jgi:hypothetical protein